MKPMIALSTTLAGPVAMTPPLATVVGDDSLLARGDVREPRKPVQEGRFFSSPNMKRARRDSNPRPSD